MSDFRDQYTADKFEQASRSIAFAKEHTSAEDFRKLNQSRKQMVWFTIFIFIVFLAAAAGVLIFVPAEQVPEGYADTRMTILTFGTVIFLIAVLPVWLILSYYVTGNLWKKYTKWYEDNNIDYTIDLQEHDAEYREQLTKLLNEPLEKMNAGTKILRILGWSALWFGVIGSLTYIVIYFTQPELLHSSKINVPQVSFVPATEAPIATETEMYERMKETFPGQIIHYDRQISDDTLTFVYTTGENQDVYFDQYQLTSGKIGSDDAQYELIISAKSERISASDVIKNEDGEYQS